MEKNDFERKYFRLNLLGSFSKLGFSEQIMQLFQLNERNAHKFAIMRLLITVNVAIFTGEYERIFRLVVAQFFVNYSFSRKPYTHYKTFRYWGLLSHSAAPFELLCVRCISVNEARNLIKYFTWKFYKIQLRPISNQILFEI